jgi:uncharacterized membrane protein
LGWSARPAAHRRAPGRAGGLGLVGLGGLAQDLGDFPLERGEGAVGSAGGPSHPPLTDVAIGAYTIAVALLVLGALGLQEPAMAHGALLALSGGLLLAPPTILTGLLEWCDLPSGTPKRKLANLHLGTMLAATGVFALSWFPGRAGYEDGRVHAAALILALAGEALLLAGGYLGGTLVYVHGHRVLSQPQTPVGEALRPGRLGVRPEALNPRSADCKSCARA